MLTFGMPEDVRAGLTRMLQTVCTAERRRRVLVKLAGDEVRAVVIFRRDGHGELCVRAQVPACASVDKIINTLFLATAANVCSGVGEDYDG